MEGQLLNHLNFSNSTMNLNDTVFKRTGKGNAVMVMVMYLLPVTTVIVNLPGIAMVIRAMIKTENLRNLHLYSTGITDAFVGIATLLILDTLKDRTSKFSFCSWSLRYYIFSVTFVASLLHIVGICVQRVKIVLNFDNNRIHTRRITEWIVITLSWIGSLLIHVVPYLIWIKHRNQETCSDEEKINLYFGIVYMVIITAVLFLLGMLFRFVYTTLRKAMNGNLGSKDLRSCATITIMAVLFVVTTTPLSVALIVTHETHHGRSQIIWKCLMASLVNSMINPFVYLYSVKDQRKSMRKLFVCSKPVEVRAVQIDEML